MRTPNKVMNLLSVCLLLSFTGCSSGIVGSGVGKIEKRETPAFTKIELDGVTKAEIGFGEAQGVEVELDDNLLAHFYTKVEGDTLKVTSEHLAAKVGPIVRVTMPRLQTLSLSGATRAKITELSAEELNLNLSGVGVVTFAGGSLEDLNAEASGSSKIETEDLELGSAKVVLSGTSRAKLGEMKKLDIQASDSSELTYSGEPEITQDLSGTSRLKVAN